MTTTRARRSASTLVLALAASTLVATVIGTGAAPAAAEPGCLDESPQTVAGIPTGNGCDDSTPPDTLLTPSSTPNAAGMVATATMTFAFTAAVSDGDPGPFGFECAFATPAAPTPAWEACTSPVTVPAQADAPAGSYGFRVRAVDLGDRPRNPDVNPLLPPAVADTPDEDPTPASLTWGQDTKAPFVFVTRSAYDEITPTQPVITTPSVPLRLDSNERGSTFECLDGERPVACTGGRWALEDPRPGRHVFTARTVDSGGHVSEWSDPVEFFVPTDLRRTRGWTKVRGDGYVDGDALRATRRGARLVLPRTAVGELRLIAASGQRLGKVRVRVGRRDWHVVDLAGPRAPLVQHVVIDRYSGMRTGRIVIESLSRRPVVVDAVVARPNRFPSGHQRTAG
ncbi:hypothetical protein KDN32_21165 [Nocardioides sp. J2M5]|uniref:hypothetical protein n=1 Tax=Nocardioides palaemonis TaxID=2829810 RepID=UPI001BAD01BA|nr:hypothetical protein [Nocardioides palaemonis]MBS2940253.1 hypothetical protein [Nocardioides palaemonis]